MTALIAATPSDIKLDKLTTYRFCRGRVAGSK